MDVTYSQMRGIYEGKRIPYIGSFVIFLQTPVGWLCIILLVFCVFALPVVKNRINKAIELRAFAIRIENSHENVPETNRTETKNEKIPY